MCKSRRVLAAIHKWYTKSTKHFLWSWNCALNITAFYQVEVCMAWDDVGMRRTNAAGQAMVGPFFQLMACPTYYYPSSFCMCVFSFPNWIAFQTRQFWQISCCYDWLWMFKEVHRNLQVQSTSHEATICCTLCMQIAWPFLSTYLSQPWTIKLLKIHETEQWRSQDIAYARAQHMNFCAKCRSF